MKRILYAEDYESLRRACKRAFAIRKYEAVICENGQVAFDAYLNEKAESRNFDLIIIDWEMPVLDGCRLVEKLRGNGYNGQIAMKTGRDIKDLEEFAKKHKVLKVSYDISKLLDAYEGRIKNDTL